MWRTTEEWVKVRGTDLHELNVPPHARHAARQEAAAQAALLGDPSDPDSPAYDLILQDVLSTWTAELVTASRQEVADQDASLPWEALAGGLAEAGEGLSRAAAGLQRAALVGGAQLAAGVGTAGTLALRTEAALYVMAHEACARGLHKDKGFSLTDWLAGRMDWPDRTLLGRIARVAEACTYPPNAPVGQAVAEGRFPVRRGAIIVDALEKVRRVLDPDSYEVYVDVLTKAAADRRMSDTDLQRAARHLLDLVLEDEEKDKRERAAEEQRSVRCQRLSTGLTRFVIDAPDRQAAIIKGLLTSRLAAPVTGPDGERDPRTASARQFDALMTVIGRGLAAPEGTPQMARATLFVTMKLDDLRRDTPGHGVSLNGDMLSARQVRQAACEAEIIPVVLGGDSEIVDFGRARRLATKEQVKALYLRDGGCTFPGCTVPAQWTIAHHAPWFSRGGATDLDKLALLCELHHTHVHQHDLECTIDETGVTWRLR